MPGIAQNNGSGARGMYSRPSLAGAVGRCAAAHLPVRQPVRIQRPYFDMAKRCIDLLFCLAVLPLVLVVLIICAILIWLEDGGPIFFWQWRTGRAGRRFPMVKLRTMQRHAHRRRTDHLQENMRSWPDFKIRRDPRVTNVGRVLRRLSLDELPQVLNVLRGDMTLVGPRPTSFPADTYTLAQTERLEVLPGLTGLWQISGRSDLEFDDRVHLDVQYIENRSMQLDLKIVLSTLGAVVFGRGAY